MAQTTNKFQIIQKVSAEDTVLIHPETEAEVVKYKGTTSGIAAENVQSIRSTSKSKTLRVAVS